MNPITSNTPAPTPAKAPRKKWAEMSKAEREADKVIRVNRAIEAVKNKHAAPSFPVTIGDFTLTCRPSGMTEKGSMSYSYPSKIIVVGGKQVRINQLSVSVYPDGSDTTDTDWDSLAGN